MKRFLLLIPLLFAIQGFAQFPLPSKQSVLFSGSGVCQDCHQGNWAALTYRDIDISPLTYWRSTMMANAGKDPLWQAKVAAEGLMNPDYKNVIENKCTTCHAPIGQNTAHWLEYSHYGMDSLNISENRLHRDGVNCTVCHQIQDVSFGHFQSFSGQFFIDDSRKIWGPYSEPVEKQMVERTQYQPVHGPWMEQAEHCATCHTLFTAYRDETGALSGSFPEQTPYLEWKNSLFGKNGISCQQCHMPQITDSLRIATRPVSGLPKRAPFYKHSFVGGNQLIPRMLRDHWFDFGVTASAEQFDSTLARASAQLQQNTVQLSIDTTAIADSLQLGVTLLNLTGHKLPTGIPIRRMWLHTKVSQGESLILESGAWDDTGEILGLDAGYEPHREIIRSSDEVQIYEGIMKDVHDSLTHTLIHAAGYLKDNRLPPQGFTDTHPSYDTTAVYGHAVLDSDFNRKNGIQGTGTDRVVYQWEIEPGRTYDIDVQICYQSVTPRFLSDLYAKDHERIALFRQKMVSELMTPVVLKDTTFQIQLPANSGLSRFSSLKDGPVLTGNYPNPFNLTTTFSYRLPRTGNVKIKIVTLQGRLVAAVSMVQRPGHHNWQWDGRDDQGCLMATGLYLCLFSYESYRMSHRILLLK